jgi:hypothetical protein
VKRMRMARSFPYHGLAPQRGTGRRRRLMDGKRITSMIPVPLGRGKQRSGGASLI